MDDYPNIPVVALDQIARLQEENARLRAALEPIKNVYAEWHGDVSPSKDRLLEAVTWCMEILGKEKADG